MVKSHIQDPATRELLERLPDDARWIYTLDGGNFRLAAVQGASMVNQMRANFGLPWPDTLVLGQAYIAGALLSSEVKGNDRIILSVECSGPVRGLSVEAWACGAVRGSLAAAPMRLESPLQGNDLGALYGPGFLSVTKILEGSRTPFKGTVAMENRDLAKDLALYYRQSEQTPTLFYLSVRFDSEARVVGAGGLFVQSLPGCPDASAARLEALLPGLPSIGERIGQGMEMGEYVEKELASMEPVFLAKSFVGFSCPCSRERSLAYLRSLPAEEKEGILREEKFPLEVRCANCGTRYSFQKEELL